MASGTDHLLEMSSSRRRFSAATGSDQRFDPTSHHPVAKDISSRIRSLLLSRNANRPPRAPNNSDEDLPRYYDVDSVQGFGDVFDFTTASRKTKREREGRMSLPALTHQSRSRSPSLISLDGVASPPPEPSGVANRGSLRTVSSESDMIDFAYNPKPDAERGYLSDGPTSPPPPPTTPPLPTSDSSKSKKPFRFPRLILKNKEKPNMLAVRSCMSTNGDDLACFIAGCKHPRLTPLEIGILREFRGHSRANSTDLANLRRSEEVRMKDGGEVDFSRRSDLEGLDEPRVLSPPSPSIYSQSTPRPLFSPSGAATAESSTEAINRPTRAITTVSPRTLSAVASKEEMSQDNKPLGIAVTNKDMQPQSAEGVPDIAPEKSAKAVQLILPQPSRKKSRLEINQGPLIPKNEEPVELVKRAQTIPRSPPEVSAPSKATVAPQPMSLPMPAKTIVQGISPMSTPTIEVDTPSSVAALSKQLDKTEKLNRKSPSLLSIASKKSSRHALLKPSGTTSPIAIDNGLPVPPILTPMDTIIGESFETHKPILDVMPEPATEEVVAVPEKRSSEKKKRFSISVVDQVGNLRKARDAVLEVEEKLRALQSDTSSVQEPQQPEVAIDCPCSVAKKPDVPQSPVHAQYWGFVPAVKDIVQNSVKDGVRAAVQEVRIPPNSEPSRASRAYRKLIGNSITEAAEEADLYLRRESIWDQPKPADVPLENDRENKTTSSQHRKPSVESVPLQTVEQALVDNIKEYRRLSKLAKNRSTIGYAAIPNRDSSRTRTKRAFSSDDAKPSESKTSALKSNDVNKTTAHWLKDMLSSNGPYESRLTARPPRTRKSDMGTTRAARSATAPAKPLENLHLVIEQDPTQESLMKKSDDPERVPVRETYTKTINDLELLFNEAMFIARQAADRSDPGYVPALLGSAAAVLQDGRKGYKGDIVKYQAEREYIDRRADNISTGSMHESLRSLSDSSDSYHSEEDEEEELQGVEEYRTQIIPPPSTAKSVRISSVPKEKPKSNQVASPRRPTPYPAPAQVADVNIVPPSSEGDDSFEDTSTVFADFDSEPVQSTVIKEKKVIQIIPEQADRVTQDMDPFLAAPKNGDDRRPSSCMSPNTARSRAATGPDDHNTSTQIVIDERAIPRALSGPVLEQLPVPVVVPTGANVSVIRLGNTSWVESNAQDVPSTERKPSRPDNLPSSQEVREYIREFHQPPIELLPRSSSLNLRKRAAIQRAAEREHHKSAGTTITTNTYAWQDMDPNLMSPCSQIRPELVQPAEEGLPQSVSHSKYAPSYDGVSASDALDFEIGYAQKPTSDDLAAGRRIQLTDNPNPGLPQQQRSSQSAKHPPAHLFSLTGKHHLSLRGAQHQGFSLTRSHKKPKIARDWSPGRKRFVASVACVSTALVGLLVGIYAAEVPAIQYYIVDFHHYVILGNVFFYIGLAIPTFFCWPLPLLHGRKPYVMGAMAIAMPLLFPQALSIQTFRSPYTSVYRVALLLPRALMGFVLGFANMNFKSTLTDLFGASLQSANPHQEVVDENDVRRHGGGLGAWLGIWTWCTIGSIGIGFMIGAVIINHAQPTWGFYVSIVIIAAVLFLNVICPEVRRSAFRRSVAEAKVDDGVSRRLGRGEVKMHMVQSGPKWWGQEMLYGIKLNMAMLRQPGFLVLAVYCGWIYGQVVLIIVVSRFVTTWH